VATNPGCESVGTEKRTCACGDFETREIPATGHSYGDWSVTTEPGCESVGVETRTCACGDSETREIAATGHHYKSVVTKPTETEKGYTTHTCENCGDSYVDSYTDKLPAKDPSNSQTGDSFNAALWMTVLVISAAAIVTVMVFGKKKLL
jgi:predicted nucleic-acid-binding Zn-ribbon protein